MQGGASGPSYGDGDVYNVLRFNHYGARQAWTVGIRGGIQLVFENLDMGDVTMQPLSGVSCLVRTPNPLLLGIRTGQEVRRGVEGDPLSMSWPYKAEAPPVLSTLWLVFEQAGDCHDFVAAVQAAVVGLTGQLGSADSTAHTTGGHHHLPGASLTVVHEAAPELHYWRRFDVVKLCKANARRRRTILVNVEGRVLHFFKFKDTARGAAANASFHPHPHRSRRQSAGIAGFGTGFGPGGRGGGAGAGMAGKALALAVNGAPHKVWVVTQDVARLVRDSEDSSRGKFLLCARRKGGGGFKIELVFSCKNEREQFAAMLQAITFRNLVWGVHPAARGTLGSLSFDNDGGPQEEDFGLLQGDGRRQHEQQQQQQQSSPSSGGRHGRGGGHHPHHHRPGAASLGSLERLLSSSPGAGKGLGAWGAGWPTVPLGVFVGTFNVGGSGPPSPDELAKWIPRPGDPENIAVRATATA